MAGDMLPNLALPIPTKIYARDAQTIGGFGLVGPPFTNAYQSPDLSLIQPCRTFTNHYRRGEETHN